MRVLKSCFQFEVARNCFIVISVCCHFSTQRKKIRAGTAEDHFQVRLDDLRRGCSCCHCTRCQQDVHLVDGSQVSKIYFCGHFFCINPSHKAKRSSRHLFKRSAVTFSYYLPDLNIYARAVRTSMHGVFMLLLYVSENRNNYGFVETKSV